MSVNKYSRAPKLIYAKADCKYCSFRKDTEIDAVKLAKKHSEKTGHSVLVTMTYTQIYGK